MREISRQDFGATSKGHVIVIEKGGNEQSSVFQVRHGAHTVAEFEKKVDAVAMAMALTGESSFV